MTETCTVTLLPAQHVFACRPNENLLEAMRRSGVAGIPMGCRGGGCGVCRIQVREGQFSFKPMSRTHISEPQERAGEALACRVYAQTDLQVEVTGRLGRRHCAAHSLAG